MTQSLTRPDAAQIREMIRLRRLGKPVQAIAEQFGFDVEYVRTLLHGRAIPQSARFVRPRLMNDVDWFWYRVDQGQSGCWRWEGRSSPSGYGIVSVSGQSVLAHRYSYEITNGPIKEGMMILHSVECSTRLCVRPDHLRQGTHRDNMADIRQKNRSALGLSTSPST